MAQHDYVIANGTGAAVRSDLNGALSAIVSQNSGATEPATMYAYQWWADTTTGLLKIRNAANNAWVTVGTLASANLGLLSSGGTVTAALGSASTPGITFTGDTNTGIYSPGADQVAISTNGTGRLFVDSSGNVTINGQGDLRLADSDSSNWVAFQAPATVASNVTWTLPAADGTSAQVLSTNGSGTLSWTSVSSDKISEGNTEAEVVDTGSDGHFKVTTEGSERLRVDPSGRLLVGTSTSTTGASSQYANLQIIGNGSAAADRGAIVNLGHSAASASVTTGEQIGVILFTDNAAGEYGMIGCYADANAGTNDYPGRLTFSTTADGASSPTERMRITNAGDLLVNTTTVSFAQNKAWMSTNFTSNEGLISQGYLAAAAYFNRQGNDGTIINLLQDGNIEGTISVSGTTVSYNGAHLSRWSQIPGVDPHDKDQRPEILRGTVMSNLDEMCDWVDPESGEAQDNEQLNKTKISDVEGDKNVAGIFQSWDDDDNTWVNDYYLAMTGDFVIRIAPGVTVERGDLLMSAGDGTAKPQADDAVRSCTVAKVTSTTVSCTYEDGSYCVPCVLMAC